MAGARWGCEFFAITKRIHNVLHGTAGDGGRLGSDEREPYEAVLAKNSTTVRQDRRRRHRPAARPPDRRHDSGAAETGAHVIWRSHIGRDVSNDHTETGWQFLRPYVEQAHATVFSRAEYVPDWVDPDKVRIIPPSLDPFSPKNADLDEEDILATLSHSGLVAFPDGHPAVDFVRRDGSSGTVHEHDDLFAAGEVVPEDARIVMQVSRWDTLKDMAGVLDAFADALPSCPTTRTCSWLALRSRA